MFAGPLGALSESGGGIKTPMVDRPYGVRDSPLYRPLSVMDRGLYSPLSFLDRGLWSGPMEWTTVARICYVGRPKCERGAHLTHGIDDCYTNLLRRTSKMRAWCASNTWNGRQLHESATSDVQNASAVRI